MVDNPIFYTIHGAEGFPRVIKVDIPIQKGDYLILVSEERGVSQGFVVAYITHNITVGSSPDKRSETILQLRPTSPVTVLEKP